jgi:hypothetical protein
VVGSQIRAFTIARVVKCHFFCGCKPTNRYFTLLEGGELHEFLPTAESEGVGSGARVTTYDVRAARADFEKSNTLSIRDDLNILLVLRADSQETLAKWAEAINWRAKAKVVSGQCGLKVQVTVVGGGVYSFYVRTCACMRAHVCMSRVCMSILYICVRILPSYPLYALHP